jgi:gliding motility-associated-like protein
MIIRSFLLGFLFCFLSLQKIQAQIGAIRQTYLPGMQWKKVIVCVEDQTVLALSAQGEVYYKLKTDANFQPFAPMQGRTVVDLAGYNFNELYFLIAPKELIYVKNGISITINTTLIGVTEIRNIATVHASVNEAVSGYMNGDWLAIATNNNLYPLFRNQENISAAYNSPNAEVKAGSGWRISNSGYKSIDFQFEDEIVDDCVGEIKHAYLNYVGQNPVKTVLPEAAPYPDKVNCTYFEAPFNENAFNANATASFWGTDDGLFAKKAFGCDPAEFKQSLKGEIIYDMEEINFLPSVANQRFLYVAGSKGLHFSVLSINRLGIWFLEFGLNFYDYPPLNDIPVYSMATEVNNLDELCENMLWLATERGIVEIPTHTNEQILSEHEKLIFSEPINGDHFDMCPGREITMTANVPDGYERNYYTQWFKEGVELTELRGQKSVTFKEPAIYHYRLQSNCTESYILQRIWLRMVDNPVITFKPASVMNICAGSATTFTTRDAADYRYQWYRNDEKIEGATANNYNTSTEGKYKVMVTNCLEGYISSDEVQLNVISLGKPVIARSSTRSLCYGESVKLSVPEISGANYLWSNGETTPGIEVKQSGTYTVQVKLGDCNGRSEAVVVNIEDEIKLEQPGELVICELRNGSLRLRANEGFAYYTWNGIKGSYNYLDVTEAGQYALEVEDAKGCKAHANYIVVSRCEILAPNAFSPNGDGINDRWVVEGLNDDPEARILIYNRYGTLVYETTGKQTYWDGKSKDHAVSAGIYYYVIFAKNSANPLKGSITLIK